LFSFGPFCAMLRGPNFKYRVPLNQLSQFIYYLHKGEDSND
jgi:hypothetical protein